MCSIVIRSCTQHPNDLRLRAGNSSFPSRGLPQAFRRPCSLGTSQALPKVLPPQGLAQARSLPSLLRCATAKKDAGDLGTRALFAFEKSGDENSCVLTAFAVYGGAVPGVVYQDTAPPRESEK